MSGSRKRFEAELRQWELIGSLLQGVGQSELRKWTLAAERQFSTPAQRRFVREMTRRRRKVA
jgi:hypothetical protein